MKKVLVFVLIGLILITFVSAFYCIEEEDNNKVKEFKYKINLISLKYDIDKGMTEESIILREKYFGGCS